MSPKMILVNEWYSGHLVYVCYLLSLKIMLAFGPCFSNNKILTPSIQLSQCNLLGFKQPPSWHRFKTFSTFLTSPHVFVYSSSQRLKQNNDSDDCFCPVFSFKPKKTGTYSFKQFEVFVFKTSNLDLVIRFGMQYASKSISRKGQINLHCI